MQRQFRLRNDDLLRCQRMLIGPCALTTAGAATVAAVATAALFRNLRRVFVRFVLSVICWFLPDSHREDEPQVEDLSRSNPGIHAAVTATPTVLRAKA